MKVGFLQKFFVLVCSPSILVHLPATHINGSATSFNWIPIFSNFRRGFALDEWEIEMGLEMKIIPVEKQH
jgi:hypothetical protein